jgi:hypothetical protein
MSSSSKCHICVVALLVEGRDVRFEEIFGTWRPQSQPYRVTYRVQASHHGASRSWRVILVGENLALSAVPITRKPNKKGETGLEEGRHEICGLSTIFPLEQDAVSYVQEIVGWVSRCLGCRSPFGISGTPNVVWYGSQGELCCPLGNYSLRLQTAWL